MCVFFDYVCVFVYEVYGVLFGLKVDVDVLLIIFILYGFLGVG